MDSISRFAVACTLLVVASAAGRDMRETPPAVSYNADGRVTFSMSVMGEEEVDGYRRRRLQEGSLNASAAVGPYHARRQLQGHIDPSSKTVMEGALGGNTMPLGYYYARVHAGTPGQVFTVIVDTGSSLMAIPCTGCSKCGKHMNPYFEPAKSSTFSEGCEAITSCKSCSGGHCTYHTHFVEGSR